MFWQLSLFWKCFSFLYMRFLKTCFRLITLNLAHVTLFFSSFLFLTFGNALMVYLWFYCVYFVFWILMFVHFWFLFWKKHVDFPFFSLLHLVDVFTFFTIKLFMCVTCVVFNMLIMYVVKEIGVCVLAVHVCRTVDGVLGHLRPSLAGIGVPWVSVLGPTDVPTLFVVVGARSCQWLVVVFQTRSTWFHGIAFVRVSCLTTTLDSLSLACESTHMLRFFPALRMPPCRWRWRWRRRLCSTDVSIVGIRLGVENVVANQCVFVVSFLVDGCRRILVLHKLSLHEISLHIWYFRE